MYFFLYKKKKERKKNSMRRREPWREFHTSWWVLIWVGIFLLCVHLPAGSGTPTCIPEPRRNMGGSTTPPPPTCRHPCHPDPAWRCCLRRWEPRGAERAPRAQKGRDSRFSPFFNAPHHCSFASGPSVLEVTPNTELKIMGANLPPQHLPRPVHAPQPSHHHHHSHTLWSLFYTFIFSKTTEALGPALRKTGWTQEKAVNAGETRRCWPEVGCGPVPDRQSAPTPPPQPPLRSQPVAGRLESFPKGRLLGNHPGPHTSSPVLSLSGKCTIYTPEQLGGL